jgi:hypothetical protein
MIMIKMGKKDRIELAITIILILIFIVLLIAFSHRIKEGRNHGLKGILPGKFSVREYLRYDSKRNQGTPLILNKTFSGTPEIKRDPFSFGLSGEIKATTASDLSLKGIMWDPDNPSAVINDHVLTVGDTISGFKVVKILKTSVILENGTLREEINE